MMMSNEDIKMSDVFELPQTPTSFWLASVAGDNGRKRKRQMVALTHAINNHDQMALRIKELEVALCEISNMCIGNLTMSYSIDPDYVGQLIYQATGMTNPELNESVKEQSK